MFVLLFHPKAEKQIKKICGRDSQVEQKLRETLQSIQENPFKAGKKLQGYNDYIRARVGYRHRIVYRVIDKVIFVVDFDTRENIY